MGWSASVRYGLSTDTDCRYTSVDVNDVGYIERHHRTISGDNAHIGKYLYIDNVVQIIAEPRLNNGQPSGHARWIASASIKQGEHVVHIGAGTGYYTAIMSHLVGPTGQVTGIEVDADLAARAEANLSASPDLPIRGSIG